MIDITFASGFDRDMRRLARKRVDLVEDLIAIMDEELSVNGSVSESYNPHVLDNPGGVYNGCMEFHLDDNVLVLFSPPFPNNSVTMRRICTHAELLCGRFGNEWPDE